MLMSSKAQALLISHHASCHIVITYLFFFWAQSLGHFHWRYTNWKATKRLSLFLNEMQNACIFLVKYCIFFFSWWCWYIIAAKGNALRWATLSYRANNQKYSKIGEFYSRTPICTLCPLLTFNFELLYVFAQNAYLFFSPPILTLLFLFFFISFHFGRILISGPNKI